MNSIWYGLIIMVIQVGIFLWVLDFLDSRPQLAEEHHHNCHNNH